MQYGWALEFLNSNVKQYDLDRKFPDYKKCSANNSAIDLLISNSHGPSMCTLSMTITLYYRVVNNDKSIRTIFICHLTTQNGQNCTQRSQSELSDICYQLKTMSLIHIETSTER